MDEIELFWGMNEDKVLKLYRLIEGIWGSDFYHRHYVFGEVMKIFLRNNSSSGLLSITRDEYIKSITENSFIRTILNISCPDYLKKHQKLIIGMKIFGIIEKLVITIKDGDDYSRVVILKLMNDKYNKIYYGLARTPYKIIIYKGEAYSINSYRDYIPLHHCSRYMVKKTIDYRGCENANEIGYIINKDVFIRTRKYLYDELFKELEICGFSSYFDYINNIKMDKKYLSIIDNSTKIRMIKACLDIKLDTIFYLPNFIDNRGRQYIMGIISPTFNKYIRKLIQIDYIMSDDTLLLKSNYYLKILKYKECVSNYKLFNDIEIYYFIILLIELSKDYIKGNSEKYLFSVDDFIYKGIDIYEKMKYDEDNSYIIYTINNLLNNRIIDKKYILYKDATASGLQNFGIISGYKQETLVYINLEGDK